MPAVFEGKGKLEMHRPYYIGGNNKDQCKSHGTLRAEIT